MRITTEGTPNMSSLDLELPPLRAVRARVAIPEFASVAVAADPNCAVDPCLNVVPLRGRADSASGLRVR